MQFYVFNRNDRYRGKSYILYIPKNFQSCRQIGWNENTYIKHKKTVCNSENCRKHDKWQVKDLSKTETFASKSNSIDQQRLQPWPPRPLSQLHMHTLKCKCVERKEVIFIHSLGGHGRGVWGYTPFHHSILYAPLCLRQPGARREGTRGVGMLPPRAFNPRREKWRACWWDHAFKCLPTSCRIKHPVFSALQLFFIHPFSSQRFFNCVCFLCVFACDLNYILHPFFCLFSNPALLSGAFQLQSFHLSFCICLSVFPPPTRVHS